VSKTQPPHEALEKVAQPMTLVISTMVRSTQDGKLISSDEVKALRDRIQNRLASELNYQHLRPGGEGMYRLDAI
jgi:hypothetical protein